MARAAVAAVLALAALAAGCGGDDGGGDAVGAIESCLEDAGLDSRSSDVNAIDSELVAAGATHQFVAIDVDNQDYTYDVTVFSSPEKANDFARKEQNDNEQQPQLKFQTESFGSNVVTASTEAPKRDDVRTCAEENG